MYFELEPIFRTPEANKFKRGIIGRASVTTWIWSKSSGESGNQNTTKTHMLADGGGEQ